MKLKNRFSEEVFGYWIGWYECLMCHSNGCDALHHIVSPSSRHYTAGTQNTSIFNSSPICNHKCHLPRHGELETTEWIVKLLKRVKQILDDDDYTYTDNDKKFLEVYNNLYDK